MIPLCGPVAEYLVGRGYDSDEIAELGTRRAIKFIDSFSKNYLLSKVDSENNQSLQIFFVHIKVFVQNLSLKDE